MTHSHVHLQAWQRSKNMPIRSQPFTFVCQACHWKKTVAPLSDALGLLDWCERCERCGSDVLTRQIAGVVDRTLAQWFTRLRR